MFFSHGSPYMIFASPVVTVQDFILEITPPRPPAQNTNGPSLIIYLYFNTEALDMILRENIPRFVSTVPFLSF